jgi:hypothetical protein
MGKNRVFFICPRWNEVADTSRIGASGMPTPIHVNEKTLAAIKGGSPSLDQRSVRHCWLRLTRLGSMFDFDEVHCGPAPRLVAVN